MADKPFAGQHPRTLGAIRDPRTGKLLGYRDPAGRQWTPEGKRTAGLPTSGGRSETLARMDQSQRDQSDKWTNSLSKRAIEARTKAGERQEQAVASSRSRKIWLDGQYVTIEEDEQGNWTTKRVGSLEDTTSTALRPSAFDALDGGQIDPTTAFLMSAGTPTPAKRGQFGSADAAERVTDKRSAGNWMTVGGAAAWLATLSTKDPEAYQAMLDKLHRAGYLTKSDLATAGGQWSSAAGAALARAARDVAVVNTTAGGLNTTLDAFLDSKQGVIDELGNADKPVYKPIERRYTDPEDIKAAAKSAAEEALGRQLTDAEEAKLTARFRALEDSAFDQVDAAGAKGESGARYTAPGSGQIDAFVEGGENEQEAANFRAAGYGQALKRLFGVATGG